MICCCVDCCLCCIEKCLKFISKEAYIQTAIHSSSFCSGAFDAFFLIARNIFRIGTVSVISGLALVIGKIWVAISVGIGAFYWFQEQFEDQLYDLVAPIILTMIIGYITASVFMDVFGMMVDTMIVCFITDCEQNGGEPQHADESLSSFLDKNGPLDENEVPLAQRKSVI